MKRLTLFLIALLCPATTFSAGMFDGGGGASLSAYTDVTTWWTGTGYMKTDGTADTPSGAGDVVGPASATDSAFALFDGTTGSLLKNGTLGISGLATSTAIGLTTGGSYSNYGAVGDDTLNELFAAIDTAIGGLGGGHDAITIATGITGIALTGANQELTVNSILENFVDNTVSTPDFSNISPAFGTVTAVSFASSAADGAHYLEAINTVSISATATAGRVAYYNGFHYIADGTDWNDYLISKERMDTFSELDSLVADKALVNKDDGAVWLGAHDFGGATSTEVPNGANPTTDAAGEIAVDTSTGAGQGVRAFGALAFTLPAYQTRCQTWAGATSSSDHMFTSLPYNITVRRIRVAQRGATNVIGSLDECDSAGASCAGLDGVTDITATTTQATDDGSLSNATVDANDVVQWHTTSVSGTNTDLMVCMDFTVDQVN